MKKMICKFCKKPAIVFLTKRSVAQWLLIGQCQQCQMGENDEKVIQLEVRKATKDRPWR